MSALHTLLSDRRVVVCCGTGGVGKTTISAALGVALARRGRRVLVMTIDPARRLADSLGVELDNQARDIPVPAPLTEGGSLSAMMLDAKRTWDQLVERYASSPEAAQRVFANRYYQKATASLSGSQEYMAAEKLLEVSRSERWDLIILDTPPSRHALDFLDAPERMMKVLDGGLIRWLAPLGARFSARLLGSRLFGSAKSHLFKVFERFTGAEVIKGLADFAAAFADLMEGFRDRAGQVRSLLTSDRATFVLVATPSGLTLHEALLFRDQLNEAGVPFGAFVVNRVQQGADAIPRGAVEEQEGVPPAPPAGLSEERYQQLLRRMWSYHRNRALARQADRARIEELRSSLAGALLREVPEFHDEVHELDVLSRVGDVLLAD